MMVKVQLFGNKKQVDLLGVERVGARKFSW
jgi:hypothetical protein